MTTTAKSVNQIITALYELEAKGCHRTFFEYGGGLIRVRIFKGETEKIVYEKTSNLTEEQEALTKVLNCINDIKYHIKTTSFQCYKREFVMGVKSGKWEKTKPVIECGDNATQSMLIDGSGYYIDDPDNGLQYFVDMKQLSETNK